MFNSLDHTKSHKVKFPELANMWVALPGNNGKLEKQYTLESYFTHIKRESVLKGVLTKPNILLHNKLVR